MIQVEEEEEELLTLQFSSLLKSNSLVAPASCCCFQEIHTHTRVYIYICDSPWCKNAQFAFLEEGRIFLGLPDVFTVAALAGERGAYLSRRLRAGRDPPAESIHLSAGRPDHAVAPPQLSATAALLLWFSCLLTGSGGAMSRLKG